MINAVAYARFSTDMQIEESIEAQIRAIEEYCSKNGYNLIKVFADRGISGTKDNRPEFQKMIDEYKQPSNIRNFDVVIVHKLDRFARNRFDSAIYKKVLKENFNIVMQKRRKNKKRPGSFKNPHTYLLSGLLVCKKSNGFYYGNKKTKQKNNKKYVYYKYVCQHRDKLNNCTSEELTKHEVEDLVINELKKVLLDSNNIDKIVDKINQKYSELYNSARTDIKDTEKEIKDTQNKIDNLIKLVADGLYNDDIKQKLEDLENNKTNLNVRLNRLKNISNNKTLNKNDILKVINFDIDKLNSNDILGIKNLLNKYINKIIVDYPNLEIHFKFSSNIDNTVKQAKKNERDNSSIYVAPLARSITNIRKDQKILNSPVCMAPFQNTFAKKYVSKFTIYNSINLILI